MDKLCGVGRIMILLAAAGALQFPTAVADDKNSSAAGTGNASEEIKWEKIVGQIPVLQTAGYEKSFGANLARTISLLETGSYTGRPVRIVFYGQSITAQHWTKLLVDYLREKYPGAVIESENYALGGWTMPALNRTLAHNILGSRPDLVVFHVYGGSLDQWDSIISEIRARTCADIILRSPHPQICSDDSHRESLDRSAAEIRSVAAKHGCEFVECRDEWGEYLKLNNMKESDFLCDNIHLNDKGCILMAQLYARHFRRNPEARGWEKSVRWFSARRQFEYHRKDQIYLEGNWRDAGTYAEATGDGNTLKLKFIGNRIDLVLPPGNGSAKILVDGLPVSRFNLCHGTFPEQDPYGNKNPVIRRYLTGPNMFPEDWTLTVTEMSRDRKRFKYSLAGSVTGPDGEGDSTKDFVSNSGRIRIFANDIGCQKAPPPEEIGGEPDAMAPPKDKIEIKWKIVGDYLDTVKAVPAPQGVDLRTAKFAYVTVADGLPYGLHELTVMPDGKEPFGIAGVEIFCPPMGEVRLGRQD